MHRYIYGTNNFVYKYSFFLIFLSFLIVAKYCRHCHSFVISFGILKCSSLKVRFSFGSIGIIMRCASMNFKWIEMKICKFEITHNSKHLSNRDNIAIDLGYEYAQPTSIDIVMVLCY